MSSMSQVQQHMMVVEQLRREASFKRLPVSQAVEELKNYVNQHASDDVLLTGFGNNKNNPYREKSSCQII